MKKLTLFLIIGLSLFFSVSPVFSQDSSADNDYKFTIKTNPLSALGGPFWVIVIPVTGEYKVLFEAAVSKKSSLQFGAGYLGPSLLLNLDELSSGDGEISGVQTSGFRLQGMYKYFVSRDLSAPEGFYVGPHVSYASANIKNKDDEAQKIDATKFNINAIIGYQLITSGGFALDIFTGMGFVSRNWDITGDSFDNEEFKDKAGVSIPFGVSFGFAF